MLGGNPLINPLTPRLFQEPVPTGEGLYDPLKVSRLHTLLTRKYIQIWITTRSFNIFFLFFENPMNLFASYYVLQFETIENNLISNKFIFTYLKSKQRLVKIALMRCALNVKVTRNSEYGPICRSLAPYCFIVWDQ